MKFCKNCGTQLPDEAFVCSNCGTALDQTPNQPVMNGQAPAPNYAQPQAPVYPNNQYQAQPQAYAQPQAPAYPNAQYQTANPYYQAAPAPLSGLAKAAKVFMIIGMILTGICCYFVGFAWTIPMTVKYLKALKEGRRLSTGFKVCCLIFVSAVGGILMLCDKDH